MSEGIDRIDYGTDPEARIVGQATPSTGDQLFLHFSWACPTLGIEQRSVQTHLVGDYNLAKRSCSNHHRPLLDVAPERIDEALTSYTPSNSRSQLITSARGNQIIADA